MEFWWIVAICWLYGWGAFSALAALVEGEHGLSMPDFLAYVVLAILYPITYPIAFVVHCSMVTRRWWAGRGN